MAAIVIPMVYGKPPRSESPAEASEPPAAGARPGARSPAEPLWSAVPPLLLAAAVLVLGVYVPQPLSDFLHRAAIAVGAE